MTTRDGVGEYSVSGPFQSPPECKVTTRDEEAAEKYAKGQCELWADWRALSEDEQEETLQGYMNLYAQGITHAREEWAEEKRELVEVLRSMVQEVETEYGSQAQSLMCKRSWEAFSKARSVLKKWSSDEKQKG